MKSVPTSSFSHPVYVISLMRSIKRRRWITKHLTEKGIGFEFCDAVDGRELVDDPLCTLSLGERACYLSHVKAWQALVGSKVRGAFVFEDDVKMLPWCLTLALEDVARLAHPGEVILLQSTARHLWKWRRRRLSHNRGTIAYTLDDTMLASAYYLTREGAAAMLEQWARVGIQFCVDHWYRRNECYPSWKGTLSVLVLQPNAFVQCEELESEIAALGRPGLSGAEFQLRYSACSPLFDGRLRHVPRDGLRVVRRWLRSWLEVPARLS